MKKSRENSLFTWVGGLFAHYRTANIAVKASVWFAVCAVLQRGVSVITLPIFTRLMSTEQFGQYHVFLTWYNILVILVTMNVHSELFNKGLIDHWEQREEYTANQAGLLITLAAAWMLVISVFHSWFERLFGMSLVLILVMLLEILGSALIGLWSARKRFDYDYPSIVKLTVSMTIINPLVGVASVLLSVHKAEARLVSNAVIPVLFAIWIVNSFRKKGRLFQNTAWWKPVMIASMPLVPHYLSLVALNQSDKLMINYFTGAADAAIYSVAHSAGLLMTIVNTSINGSFVPWAYDKLKNHDGERIREVSNALLIIVLAANVLMIWIAPEVVRLLAAPQYFDAVWCLVPIAMSVFFFFTYTLFVDVEIYYGANRLIAAASVCAAVLNIVLNAIFIPRFGYLAAGYTTLFSYFATMIMHMLFLKKVLKGHHLLSDLFDLRLLTLGTLMMLLFSAVGMLLYGHPWLRLGLVAAFCMVAVVKRGTILSILLEMKKRE